MVPPFLRKSSPLLTLHGLALLRNLTLELLAFAGELPQSGRRVGKPRSCCFQGCLVGLLLAIGILERHADGPDGVEGEVVVGRESDAAGLDGVD